MQELTGRQRQVLDFIVSHIDGTGYPPTQREIARHLGVSGTLPVAKHLAALEKKGCLRRDEGSRSIALTRPAGASISVPIAGTVRAGTLSPAIEDIQGYFSVDRGEIKGAGCFFLRVSGDSMIAAGIFDGDLALVRPQPTAENKDTVVAMVDGEATVKWFYRERDGIRLQPANPDMKAIILRPEDGEVNIVGKVIGIYRRMR
ncbi:transcriptional repressor LexA [Geobacter sp. AOG2]|uniref:transcriptional repressor LexA n=1 Tax=Geobacter sp. AOG2 TaxID=1566347 RepID=UPI001CC6AA51|nr:transcriptional repressor LexA [Geobacter sp. AOG2]GFE62040.1 LexA repressor 1 [Geobacter sp. AOG2]